MRVSAGLLEVKHIRDIHKYIQYFGFYRENVWSTKELS